MLMKLLLSGDGGQGIQLMSDIVCQAAFDNGWQVSHIPNYGLEQRGGVSLAFIQISDKEIAYARFSQPNVMVILSDQARIRTAAYRSNKTKNNIKILDIENYKNNLNTNEVKSQCFNIFFLGMVTKILVEKKIVTAEEIIKLLENKLGGKLNWEENKKVFEIGISIEKN